MTLIKSISGIRGTVGGTPGTNLTPIDIVKYTSAFGTWIISKSGNRRIVIGRDARPSGDSINKLICNTLIMMGMDVVDLGVTTTPTVEIAVPMESAGGAIIITASHNPVQWNALKLLNSNGEFLTDVEGSEILDIAEKGNSKYAEVHHLGKYTTDDSYLEKHIQKILSLPEVDVEAIKDCDFKVIVDGVNSSGGLAVPALLEALGVSRVKEMFCEPTGHFPHNPEPLPENMSQLIQEMHHENFDLGIVVDPDVDRLALVAETGEPFGEEYTLVAIADYILQNKIGPTVSNLSSSQALQHITNKSGAESFSAAVGEVNVVAKMKEVHAVIGGEGNGGIILPDLHYGRDALVGIALFLSYLAKLGQTASKLRSKFPNYVISKNKIELSEDINTDHILQMIIEQYEGHPINTVDGVKIEFPENGRQDLTEWVHLRKSNTEPIIRIYAESDSEATADHLAHKIISDIKELIST